MSGEAVIRQYLEAISTFDTEALAAIVAEDASIQVPFAPPGMADRHEGRAAILELVGGYGQMIDTLNLTVTEVEALARPDEYVALYQSDAWIKPTGLPYKNFYIARFTLRDGQVLRHVEYLDTLVMATALGATISMPGAG
ncbi:nuclear transport factor 2 family protein [Sporichthya sp.]|uniref:nuclear transport factor 2 family protein n=1 Tax=Sporichthya sp. TaxID=65475 RepID=UPI0017B9D147|nr:nuclear transport factor 2 family protein [Sporichthya sp.]MBA3741418.1 nuclear transport factor 2 family protein [Sporichthya sp.]